MIIRMVYSTFLLIDPKMIESSYKPRSGTDRSATRCLVEALIASTALGGAACQKMVETAPAASSTVSFSGTNSSSFYSRSEASGTEAARPLQKLMEQPVVAAQPAEPQNIPHTQVIPITVSGERPTDPWAGIPAHCVYTGEVLSHELSTAPHRILLENMCIQKRTEMGQVMRKIFEGEHLSVNQDAEGHYPIPFFDSYLRENSDGHLIFVTKHGDRQVQLALEMNGRHPSFARLLDYYKVRAFAPGK